MTERLCGRPATITELHSGTKESLCSEHALEKYNKSLKERHEQASTKKGRLFFEPARSQDRL
jgi:hypothetical protein